LRLIGNHWLNTELWMIQRIRNSAKVLSGARVEQDLKLHRQLADRLGFAAFVEFSARLRIYIALVVLCRSDRPIRSGGDGPAHSSSKTALADPIEPAEECPPGALAASIRRVDRRRARHRRAVDRIDLLP
jgi:hypothetical protein